ncbi:hypothetical protein AAC387_Pa05g2292 [Persea americana]
MGRAPCCDKANVKRGPWSPEEDTALRNYVQKHGTGGNWIALPHKAGLKRCGKSCRLRWLNYLRPDIKHGGFTEEEDYIICTLHQNIGSRWSVIASHLPGRTDNDVKNYWNTKLKKKLAVLANSAHVTTNNHTQLSTSTSPVSCIKSRNHVNCFSTAIDKSLDGASSIETGSGCNVESQNLYSDSNQFPVLGLKEISDFGVRADSYGVSSSSFPVDNSCISLSGNGYGEADSFLVDMGYGSAYDLLHGYSSQEKILEVAPGLANFSYSKLLASAETKPHGLHQSITL